MRNRHRALLLYSALACLPSSSFLLPRGARLLPSASAPKFQHEPSSRVARRSACTARHANSRRVGSERPPEFLSDDDVFYFHDPGTSSKIWLVGTTHNTKASSKVWSYNMYIPVSSVQEYVGCGCEMLTLGGCSLCHVGGRGCLSCGWCDRIGQIHPRVFGISSFALHCGFVEKLTATCF